jgi:cathepsin B
MILLLFSLAYALDLEAIVREVNSRKDVTWTAALNPRFKEMTKAQFDSMNRAKFTPPDFKSFNSVPIPKNLPETFDAAAEWPMCETIGHIYDQGHCGSCWAMAAFESLQDRFCIHSNGTRKPLISAQHMTSCTPGCYGCNGGWSASAFSFARGNGIASEECIPYQMGECAHPGCTTWPTPKCNKTCYPDSSMPLDPTKSYAASYKSTKNNEEQIMSEIMTFGPVTAAFTVYADFATYKSGVYYHVSGAASGGHAVKIVGWGILNGTKYWKIANSWNTDWGMDGYFLMRRGKNDCGIESDIVSAMPKL